MRVLHLMSARYFVGEAGRVLDLVAALRGRGHEVDLLLRAGHAPAAEASARGLEHACLRFAGGCSATDLLDVLAVRRVVRARKMEVVHAHRGKDHWLAAAALAGMRARARLVRTRHVVMPVRRHCANRWLYGRATQGLVAVSRSVAGVLARDLPAFPGVLAVIPGGCDQQRVAPASPADVEKLRERLRLPVDALVITQLARVAPIKGQVHALGAFARLAAGHPRAYLLLAYQRADDAYRMELERAMLAAGIRERVRWLGPQARLGPLLGLTTIGLVASVGSEGWSRAAVEYMHAGLPVVATRVGSLPELLEPGRAGLLVPPADAEGMARALEELVGSEARRRELGLAARAAAAEFTSERLAARVEDFYERVMRKNLE